MRNALLIAIIAFVVAAPVEAAGPPTPAARCEANKLKTAGKYGKCLLKALSKAAKKETPEADYSRCDGKLLTTWEKIEAKGGCGVTGDVAGVGAVAIGHAGAALSFSLPITRIAAGDAHTCAIDGSGALGCWGHGKRDRPCLIGGNCRQSLPPGGTFTQVTAGTRFTCAINSSGAVQCWGRSFPKFITPPAGTFTQISGGWWHTCGINSSGAVECWGRDLSGESSPPAGTFTQVTAGTRFTCAINSSGSVECWGEGGCGVTTSFEFGQACPPAGTFTQLSAGGPHTCAINDSGGVECWGSDSSGQSSPPVGTFTQLSAGGAHTCAINDSGGVECWGSDSAGQSSPPVGTFTQLSAGGAHTCVINDSGEVECWGSDSLGQSSPLLVFRCWAAPLNVLGKYGACRLKREASAVKTDTSADYSSCVAQFTANWSRKIAKRGARCPDLADFESPFQAEAVSYADSITVMLAGQ